MTLATIEDPEFHQFIHAKDIVAMVEEDEEGLHDPFMLDTFDMTI